MKMVFTVQTTKDKDLLAEVTVITVVAIKAEVKAAIEAEVKATIQAEEMTSSWKEDSLNGYSKEKSMSMIGRSILMTQQRGKRTLNAKNATKWAIQEEHALV